MVCEKCMFIIDDDDHDDGGGGIIYIEFCQIVTD